MVVMSLGFGDSGEGHQMARLSCLPRVAVVLTSHIQKTSLKLPGFLKSLDEVCLAWGIVLNMDMRNAGILKA